MTLTILFACYFLFVLCRDGQDVAYKVWALYHNYIYVPLQSRRGWRVQYASNTSPPFNWMKQAATK